MKRKAREFSAKIKNLRIALGANQAQFAELVGITQSRISDWESESGVSKPSADSFMRLGNLAPFPDNLWFWKQAGLKTQKILPVFSDILKKRGQAPELGAIIQVPRLVINGSHEADDPIPFPSKFIPNPAAVAYWVADEPGPDPLLRAGTVVILDTSETSAVDLQPFWDKVVLIETTEETKLDIPYAAPPAGVHMGRLRCAVSGGGEYALRSVILETLDRFPNPNEALMLGRWTVEITPNKSKVMREGRFDDVLMRERAKAELRLFRGCTILGRVIDWFRPPEKRK